jgi:hypothetical protein
MVRELMTKHFNPFKQLRENFIEKIPFNFFFDYFFPLLCFDLLAGKSTEKNKY